MPPYWKLKFNTVGQTGGWGNDTLTGGNGWGGVFADHFTIGVSNEFVDQSFLNGVHSEPGPGNTGDNFFPEGGTDIVNIAAGEVGKLASFQEVTAGPEACSSPAATISPTIALCGLGSTTSATPQDPTPVTTVGFDRGGSTRSC